MKAFAASLLPFAERPQTDLSRNRFAFLPPSCAQLVSDLDWYESQLVAAKLGVSWEASVEVVVPYGIIQVIARSSSEVRRLRAEFGKMRFEEV